MKHWLLARSWLLDRADACCAESTTPQLAFRQRLTSDDHVAVTGHNALARFLQNPSGIYVGVFDISKGCQNTICSSA